MLSRVINLLVALTAITLGGFLALNYPVGTLLPISGFVAIAVISFYQPSLFLIIIPAILPVSGFAPWTGWISFEELDLLVLATAAGGYARCAFDGKLDATQRTSSILLLLSFLMSVSILISMTRGFADAGGFVFDWFQGYDGPMNSIRIGKSFFLALLLTPLITRLQSTHKDRTGRQLALGIAIGLGTASLAALWERLAFTDLLNFSSDYRSTALFWEMHVGGAALDGWLLLTIPFSIWALRNARNSQQFVISLCLLGLAAYASLTTFSRGVYLALIVTLPLLAWQTRRQAKVTESGQETLHWGFSRWTVAIVLIGTMAGLVFPNGGYRGLMALLGLIAVALSMPPVLRRMSVARLLAGSSVGVLFGAFLIVVANFLPKGPYVLYTLLLSLTFLALYWRRIRETKEGATICTASFVGLMLASANVTGYWGGIEGLPETFAALFGLLLILVWGTFAKRPLWPDDLRWQGGLLVIAMAFSGIIAVFGGGAYMGERFSTSGSDLDHRVSHWRQAITMLKTPWDIVFGKGLGRFPANYYFDIPAGNFPGSYRITAEDGNSFLSLVAPRHPLSFGDVLRISQRLNFDAHGPFELDFKVRAKAAVEIHAEVCEKHLLYAGNCAIANVAVKPTHGAWQSVHVRLDGPLLGAGPWYAPRLKMFSLAIGNQSGAADIDDLLLSTSGSPDLLANSNFSKEMQHWFFSSDRDHMPWHAKNLLVNIFFDQGAAGLAVFVLLTTCALWRLNLGHARHHELAPYLTAGIVGFLVVGIFDSLTDVPRLAFLYYLMTLYAVSLGVHARHQTKKKKSRQMPPPRMLEQ